MCGIVGFSGKKDAKRLNSMLACITHRGPDDQAVLEKPNFSLGMRRLSIIDLSNNIYPVSNSDGSVQAVFNGEIYNYQQIRSELKAKGYEFKTQSDSEVIVHGYTEWGIDFVSRLRGMFAISIYDALRDEVLLIRDRVGIKPLYYAEHEGRVVWSSEIKAILQNWPIDRSPDEVSVYKFLLTRVHDDSKRTFFKEVKRLLPGHYMSIDSQGNYRIQRYWFPKTNTSFRSERPDVYYSGALKELLLESMRLHLITDVPLGVNLSGGLDSSGVVCLANKLLQEGTDLHTNKQLLTFSAVHPGQPIDESKYIDQVIDFTGAKSIRVQPSLEQFWEDIDTWLYYQEEPTISTAPYAYYVVMQEAGKHVKVLLSGQGGDELFAGYIPYFMSYINTAKDANAYWQILRESLKGFDLYAPFIKQKIQEKLARGAAVLSVRSLVNSAGMEALENNEEVGFKHRRNLNARLFEDLTTSTIPNLLRYEDKNSMAHSIESRVPLLDHELIEFAHSLPADQKIKHGWNRFVYRQAMKGLMPEPIRLRRNKVGFVNMEWEWMKARFERIDGIFASAEFESRPYWDAPKVRSEFSEWVAGKRKGDGLMFWRILSVELWLRSYVDKVPSLVK